MGNNTPGKFTKTYDLVGGTYTPIRVLWANGPGGSLMSMTVTAPDGTNINTSDWFVTKPCDATAAKAYTPYTKGTPAANSNYAICQSH